MRKTNEGDDFFYIDGDFNFEVIIYIIYHLHPTLTEFNPIMLIASVMKKEQIFKFWMLID